MNEELRIKWLLSSIHYIDSENNRGLVGRQVMQFTGVIKYNPPTMNFTETPFLTQTSNGTIRFKGSRLNFDTVAVHIQQGRTPEEIHDSFPSVTVEQIVGVIAWYKDHKAEADEYLRIGEAEAEKLRQEIESDPRYQVLNEKFRQRKEQLMASKQLTQSK